MGFLRRTERQRLLTYEPNTDEPSLAPSAKRAIALDRLRSPHSRRMSFVTSSSMSSVATFDASANAVSSRLSQIALMRRGMPCDRRWISAMSCGDKHRLIRQAGRCEAAVDVVGGVLFVERA